MLKKILMLVISIIVVLVILSTTTYAILYKQDSFANTEEYTSGVLDIVLDNDEEGLGEVLNLTNSIPIEDSEGKTTVPYKFKITNKGNVTYSFDLKIISTTSSNEVDKKHIKLMIEEDEPIKLSDIENNIVKSNLVLTPNQSIIISIRIWLDDGTPNTEMGKKFSAKIVTDGVAIEEPKVASEYLMMISNGSEWSTGDSGLYEVTYIDEEGNTLTRDSDNSTKKVKDYRYIGAVPNNYVEFNNDMYRIIGIFDDNTHGVTDKYLVKLISVNSLITTSYGSYNTTNTSGVYGGASNDWVGTEYATKTNANILLNEYFYNRINTSNTYGNCSNWTYYYSLENSKTKDCSTLVGYGIKDEYRDYIETVTWHLNGYSDTSLSANDMYLCERGLYTGCSSSNNGGGASTTSAKIALMYVSDFVLARANTKTTLTELSQNLNGLENWLYYCRESFISPVTTTSNVNYIYGPQSYIYADFNSYRGYSIRPTFYLKSDVKIIGGTGTYNNPYQIDI